MGDTAPMTASIALCVRVCVLHIHTHTWVPGTAHPVCHLPFLSLPLLGAEGLAEVRGLQASRLPLGLGLGTQTATRGRCPSARCLLLCGSRGVEKLPRIILKPEGEQPGSFPAVPALLRLMTGLLPLSP